MNHPSMIQTSRIQLRPWRDDDLAAFAAMNADPRVMEFLPGPVDRVASDERVAQIREHFSRHGFGFWAVNRRDGAGAES